MANLLSIRMRASRTVRGRKEMHVSGAEGLFERDDVQTVVNRYVERAFTHSKGRADKVIITIEDVGQRPRSISALPVATVDCRTPAEGQKIITRLLRSLGVSKMAIGAAFGEIRKGAMRGAVIIAAERGEHLEPDKDRGIRVSRLGISKQSSKSLSSRLSRQGINTDTVREALILASKVISHWDVVAELCISDDPDYTTGYVASKKFGYLRIPHIKHKRSRSGGRAFFVKGSADVGEMINYLEKAPVLIGEVSSCRGIVSIDEILSAKRKV